MTLDIDDGVLAAARAIAKAENRSVGSVISELAGRALASAERNAGTSPTSDVPAGAPAITPDVVDRALDE